MNRREITAATLLFVAITAAYATADQPTIAIYFSPKGGAADAIAAAIDAATTRVWAMEYSLSESRITAALIRAQTRHVDVHIIVDPHQQSDVYSTAPKLYKAGVPIVVDANHQLMHDKTFVIDSTTTITGSANATRSAESDNAENVVIITDATVNATFAANFQTHLAHCHGYTIHAKPRLRPIEFPTQPVSPPTPPTQQEPQ
jgi:phosphatidylserine/phosphatidylglycerophosphate/cardiolipin synthase-like enzyme